MSAAPHIVVLSGGVGGARFTRGLLHHLRAAYPDGSGGTTARLTVIANTGDDAWVAGVRVCPDLDSITYTLAGISDDERGWGRRDETERVSAELAAYGVGWPWFTLGDLDLGTCIARAAWLRDGVGLGEVTRRITARWGVDIELLPATEHEAETLVRLDDDTEIHFEEWWVRYRAKRPALAFRQENIAEARPAPGVLDAIANADTIIVAPSNPVVSVGTITGFAGPASEVPGIPGIREAVLASSATVVGVSPIIGGAAVRGMAEACLAPLGVETSAAAVARAHGSRRTGGLLDAWLIDDADAASIDNTGMPTRARPLWFTSIDETAAIAADALELAESVRG